MQESFTLERLHTEPQTLTTQWPIGTIRLEFLRWPRGEMAATADSLSPVFCNRVYELDGIGYREQPTHTLRSRFSLLQGMGCQGVSLAAREDLTKVRVLLDAEAPSASSGSEETDMEFGVFQIRKSSPESGGEFSPFNTWIPRPFNHVSAPFGQLDAFGQIQLSPGHYALNGWSTGMEGGRMRVRFRSLDSSILWPGASSYSLHYSWHIPVHGVFTVTEATTFLLEMWCDRDHRKDWGFGFTSTVAPDLYASLLFYRKQL